MFRHMSRVALIIFATLTAAALVSPAFAQGSQFLWKLNGAVNTVFVLGSFHVLRPSHHPLPDEFIEAYEQSDVIYMELDMDDLNPLADFGLARSMALLPDGQTLKDVLGETTYAEVAELAGNSDIDLSLFKQTKPWFAAMTMDQLRLMRLGYEAEYGVEMFFTRKAQADAKEILGLETTEYQLGIFDSMSLDTQIDFLLSTLEDVSDYDKRMDSFIAAWQSGDTEFIDKELMPMMFDSPDLYEALIVARNRNFAEKIATLTDDDVNYLIIVGAGHLAGEHSVIEMLRQIGYPADQL